MVSQSLFASSTRSALASVRDRREAVAAIHRAAEDDRVAGLIARVQLPAAAAGPVQELRALADEHGIAFIEDAAHSPDAHVDGRMLGTEGRNAILPILALVVYFLATVACALTELLGEKTARFEPVRS